MYRKDIMEPVETSTTLVFSGVVPALVESLVLELRSDPQSPLQGLEHIEVFRHPEGLVLKLNKGERGFTFCRRPLGFENDVETFRAFLHNPVAAQYIPMTYEIMAEGDTSVQSVAEDILASYEKAHGHTLAKKIDWLVWSTGGAATTNTFLIVLLPREIVERLMRDQGGRLTTMFGGRVGALRKIKTLAPVLPEDAEDDEVVRRGLVTEYGKGGHLACFSIHQSVVREICRHPGQGITIGPIGVWSP
jgi:hypothetical protein